MSRIGKIPVAVPKNVKVGVDSSHVHVEGPNGKLELRLPCGIHVELKDSRLIVGRTADTKQDRSNHGTIRAHLVNMITGVTQGHKKELELQGVGFRAQLHGKKIVFNLGFSHPIEFEVPAQVKVTVPVQTSIILEGADNIAVGQAAASIRAIKPAEPYKGKGIRYVGEIVRRKQGKSVTK